MFKKHEIVGPHIGQYIISLDLWSSVILDIVLECTIEYLRKYIFKFCTRVGHPLLKPHSRHRSNPPIIVKFFHVYPVIQNTEGFADMN